MSRLKLYPVTVILLASALAFSLRAQVCSGSGPTLKSIAVDGNAADWSNVLSNAVQVTNDGEWLSPCTTSTDRDCAGRSISGRDLRKFAWTYDNTSIFQYVQRFGSSNNTQTYYFYIDTNGNQGMNTDEKVLQVVYNGSNRRTDATVYNYVAVAVGVAGDAMAGLTGFADGYTLPGTLTGGTVVYSNVAAGFADGSGFESSIPWLSLGVPVGSPLFFHVSSTNSSNANQVPASLDDNLGGPDGRIGTFAFYASALAPNNSSAVAPGSPTVVNYSHVLTNTGTLADRYNLTAISTQGLRVDLYDQAGVVLIATDNQGDGIWEFVESTPDFDFDNNGQPDSPLLAAGGTFQFQIRLTAATGISDILDNTVIRVWSINNAVCNNFNIVTATDITAIGNLTLQNSPQSKSVVAGQTVDFGLRLRNFSLADVFDLKTLSSQGWQAQLYTDPNGDGNPADGLLAATDLNGNGVFTDGGDSIALGYDSNANNLPDFGSLPNGSSQTFVIRLTGAGAVGTVDSSSVRAKGAANGTEATALLSTTVRSRLSFTPSYTIAAGNNKFSGANRPVFYAHTLINSWPQADSVTLAGVSSNGYTVRIYTDPNGDGSPADGVQITAPVALAASGGTLQLVVEVVIPVVTPPLTDTVTVTATTSIAPPIAPVPSVTDQVMISFVSVYSDALRTLSFGNYTRCQTVFTQGNSLTPGTTTTYQMRYRNPSSALVRSQTIPTDGNGEAVDQYTFTASDPVGVWTVQLFNLNTATIVDSATITLENFAASTITPIATGKASYAVSGDNLNISARFNNGNAAAADTGTTFRYVVLNPGGTQYLTAAGTFAAAGPGLYTHTTAAASIQAGGFANDSFTVSNVLFPSAGTYQISVDWVTSCGAIIATASHSFPVGSSFNSFSDAAFTQPSDLFGIGATLYLNGPNQLASTAYKIAYYRPDGTLALTQNVSSNGAGTLTSSATTASLGVSGLWRVVVYLATLTPPANYVPNDAAAAANDSFTLDLAAPVSPAVVSPANGSSTTSTTPTLSGTAEAGSTVTLTITGPGGPYIVTTTADGSGNYSVSAPVLAQGAYSVSATATDLAGNVSTASGANGFNVVFAAPVLTGPINAGAGSISGTSSAPDGTTITVYSNGTPIGTTTVSGGTWTLSGVTGLAGGESITSTTGTGAATSAPSPAIIVIPAAPSITGPVVTGGPVTVGGTSGAPNGSTVTVLVNGTPVVCTPGATVSGGVWSCGGLTLAPGDVVTATVTANGQTSSGSGSQTVQFAAPSLSGPINAGASSISGTSNAADGTTITVYSNGTPIGTTTVTGGVWTLSGVTGLQGGESITATTGTGAAISANSPAIIVIPAAPSITGPVLTGTGVTVGGTSGAPNGSTVTVLVNGTPVVCTPGATVSGGVWSCGGLTLAPGDVVTATVTANGQTSSGSGSQTVQYAAPGLNGPIVAGASSVSGTSSAADGTTITVYNNGTPIGTTTVTGGTWTLSGVTGLAAGNSVTATVGTGAAQSAASGSQMVIHQTPAITSPIYPTDTSISGTSGSPNGTTITVYNNGTPIGTTTVSGGTWTLSGLSGLSGGNSITATAGAGATTSVLSAPVTVAPLPGLLRNAAQGTLTPTAATFPRAPGDPSLGTGDRVVFLFASAASYPQESTDYTDQTAPIVFYQLEANSGNTLRIAKDNLNGKLVITYTP